MSGLVAPSHRLHGEERRTAMTINPPASYAGLTRVSIALPKSLSKMMDHRVKPGDDECSKTYRSLIGAAVFSAGAGGKAGVAPAFCASASGRAGSGGISPGRLPVVAGSAGADGFVSAPGVDCNGWVACRHLLVARVKKLGCGNAGYDKPRRNHHAGEQHVPPVRAFPVVGSHGFTLILFRDSTGARTQSSRWNNGQTFICRQEAFLPPLLLPALLQGATPWQSK